MNLACLFENNDLAGQKCPNFDLSLQSPFGLFWIANLENLDIVGKLEALLVQFIAKVELPQHSEINGGQARLEIGNRLLKQLIRLNIIKNINLKPP